MPLFVVLADGAVLDDLLRDTIRHAIRTGASPRHVPDEILQVPGIPHRQEARSSCQAPAPGRPRRRGGERGSRRRTRTHRLLRPLGQRAPTFRTGSQVRLSGLPARRTRRRGRRRHGGRPVADGAQGDARAGPARDPRSSGRTRSSPPSASSTGRTPTTTPRGTGGPASERGCRPGCAKKMKATAANVTSRSRPPPSSDGTGTTRRRPGTRTVVLEAVESLTEQYDCAAGASGRSVSVVECRR